MAYTKFLYSINRIILLFSILIQRRKYLCIIILVFIAATNSNAQDIQFRASTAEVRLKGPPADVMRQIQIHDLHFSKERSNYLNFGIAGDVFKYFVIKISSEKDSGKKILSIDNTSLDTVSIYRIYDNQTSNLLYTGGCLVPYDKKKIYVWHTLPLKITTTPSLYLIALKSSQKNINVRYDILNGVQLHQKYMAHDRVIWFYGGVVALNLLTVLVAFSFFRNKIFIIYLGYIISLSVWIFAHYGYLFPYVYPDLPVLNEIVKPISSLGAGYFLITLLVKVFRENLKQQQWLYLMLTAMRLILPVLCMCMFLLLLPNFSTFLKGTLIVLWQIGLLFSVCLIVFTPLYFIRSGAVAKIFFTAMCVIGIMSVVQQFGNSGYIYNYFINEHGITMASILENFIIAFGLFYSLLQENNKKKKQMMALQSAQSETLEKLINVQDSERKRIANDLHDNIGPLLAAIKINFRRLIDNKDALQNGLVHKTEEIIDDSILEIRNVAHNLMPKSLSSKGLIEVLREYFEEIEQLYNKKIIFNHQVQSILQDEVQLNIYRIICELVLNAVKHSEANELIICIASNDVCIRVNIKDDGKGFNVKSADFKKSFGLQSAESRIQFMKGKFALKTSPGHGTMIDMEIPL